MTEPLAVTVSPETLALMKRDKDFLAYMKQEPSAGDVHAPSSGGAKKPKKKPPDFKDIISTVGELPGPGKVGKDMLQERLDKALLDMEAAHQAERDALAKEFGLTYDEAPIRERMHAVDKKGAQRHLRPHEDGGTYSPFPFDPNAMNGLHEEQMRRFLGALTDQDAQENRKVSINSLVAIQPRVDPDKIESMGRTLRDGEVHKVDLKKPLVVRWNGKNYLADGHHRAAAHWLAGANSIECKYCNLGGKDEELTKEWELAVPIVKVDQERQLMFGVASLVQEGNYLVIDKQGDMITPRELENAVYEYVLEARQHGAMHSDIGTGRLAESYVVTEEKRAALKKIGLTLSLKNDDGEEVSAWLTGHKVDDVPTWERIKAGELPELSIGGSGSRIEIS